MDSLPGGLQARVEQGGRNFSGGQKQRLAIARALTKRADLYIFDDSFSALDFQTDAALRRALRQEVAGSAVLIIAQRVSTIAHADPRSLSWRTAGRWASAAMRSCWRPARSTGRLPNPKGKEGRADGGTEEDPGGGGGRFPV